MQILGEGDQSDFVITEIGGTVGDIEIFRSWRPFAKCAGNTAATTLVVHVTLVPYCLQPVS